MMEKNIAFSDDPLAKCICLFKQYESNHDDALKKEGIHSLELAKQTINKKTYITHGPKWGGCLEYLTQKFHLDYNTDDILFELDVYINNQLNNNAIIGSSIYDILWVGDYFLLRYLNKKSQLKYLSRKSIYSILLLYINIFKTTRNQTIFTEALFFFPLNVCIDLKEWLDILLKKEIFIKEVFYILTKIEELEKNDEFLSNKYTLDLIRQEIRSFIIQH